METSVLMHVPFNPAGFYLFVFGATLLQYNIHYFLKKPVVHHSRRWQWSVKNNSAYQLLIGIGALMVIIGLFSFNFHHFVFLVILGGITFLYSIPVLPFKNKKRIKDFGLLKILTISLLWTIVTVWFPIQQSFYGDLMFLLIFIRRFIFIFVLCLMFDIRDVDIDRRERINTLPAITGIQKAYDIGYVGMGVFILICIIQYIIVHDTRQLTAMLISAGTTLWLIKYSKQNHSDLVYLAGFDGMMFLQALLVITCSI